MKKKRPIEFFMPPNMLKAKVGGTAVGLDMSAVKRAEDAMTALKSEFVDWIAIDVATLATSFDAFAVEPNADTQGNLYRASFDLLGQARTFEFPLIERVASSLCRLLDASQVSAVIPLIDAHVSAIRVIVRENIRDRTNMMATTLAKELEARVDESLANA